MTVESSIAEIVSDGDNTAAQLRTALTELVAADAIGRYPAGTVERSWDGTDVAAGTEVAIGGTQTLDEIDNQLSVVATNAWTNADAGALLYAETIGVGDAWMIPITNMIWGNDASFDAPIGIGFTDGTVAASNVVFNAMSVQTGVITSFNPRGGTLTAANAVGYGGQALGNLGGTPVWLRITYTAANTFDFDFSFDGYVWQPAGNQASKTMTPTHVGPIWLPQTRSDQRMVRFGPMIKVAA